MLTLDFLIESKVDMLMSDRFHCPLVYSWKQKQRYKNQYNDDWQIDEQKDLNYWKIPELVSLHKVKPVELKSMQNIAINLTKEEEFLNFFPLIFLIC